MTQTSRKWIVVRPLTENRLSETHFEMRFETLPEPAESEALVRVNLINIHSATRARIANGMTRIGDTDRTNYACATVIRSRDPIFREGEVIACQAGWQEHQIISSKESSVGYGPISAGVKELNRTNSQWTYVFRPEIVKRWSAGVLMEMFGTSGMTAYFGMRQCGPIGPDDTVVVAGATGSVGSIVAQLARVAGSRVIGFAGGPERCKWVIDTLGIADCIDYKADNFARRLAGACLEGIDVFSDGIGGNLTDTVTRMMNQNGRLFAYGGAGAYYADHVAASNHMTSPQQQRMTLRQAFGISDGVEQTLREKDIRAEAWIVDTFYHDRLTAEDELSRLLSRGDIKPVNTVVDGFDNLPAAIVGLYENPRAGKLQVRFS